jgi:DNA-directed RNA polymerase specialized sigma subunit, sigma24 homolog
MKNSEERRIQNQFGAFCTRVLKNEALRIEAEFSHAFDREKPFNDLSENELAQMKSIDKYFESSHVFEVHGLPVVVVGDLLAKALSELSKEKQDIILLSYFLDLSDREIGERTHAIQQTVSKRRLGILKELRTILEKEGYVWLEELH